MNSFQLGQTWLVRVNLSSGLHYGWAIEGGIPFKAAEMWVFLSTQKALTMQSAGAVGSEFKIDASYLSPNVRNL